jgi:hypothetical protein
MLKPVFSAAFFSLSIDDCIPRNCSDRSWRRKSHGIDGFFRNIRKERRVLLRENSQRTEIVTAYRQGRTCDATKTGFGPRDARHL